MKTVEYLRRQGGQCNKQQPIVPAAGSELLKAADTIEALVADIREIEALCHQETRQKLLAICHRALARIRPIEGWGR